MGIRDLIGGQPVATPEIISSEVEVRQFIAGRSDVIDNTVAIIGQALEAMLGGVKSAASHVAETAFQSPPAEFQVVAPQPVETLAPVEVQTETTTNVIDFDAHRKAVYAVYAKQQPRPDLDLAA